MQMNNLPVELGIAVLSGVVGLAIGFGTAQAICDGFSRVGAIIIGLLVLLVLVVSVPLFREYLNRPRLR